MISIALADDHQLLRTGLVLLAESFNDIKVVADADDGDKLINIISCLDKLPDVCILDVRMPVLDGHQTLLRIKNRWPGIKVLMLTMYTSDLNILKFIHAGADGYLSKDLDSNEFYKAINRVHLGAFYYPDHLLRKISSALANSNQNKYLELSENEYNFLSYCCSELTLKEIAARMIMSVRTVEGYRDTLFKKLNVNSRTGLVLYALESGIYIR